MANKRASVKGFRQNREDKKGKHVMVFKSRKKARPIVSIRPNGMKKQVDLFSSGNQHCKEGIQVVVDIGKVEVSRGENQEVNKGVNQQLGLV
ncbi:hypothetical protein QYF36_004319 [Acer negundo]|nr:hypothetical protein QYF36_004319 [Acer negundo]